MTDASRAEIESEIDEIVAEYDGLAYSSATIFDVGSGERFQGEVGGLKLTFAADPDVEYETVDAAVEWVQNLLEEYDVESSRDREDEAFDGTKDAKGGPYVVVLTSQVEEVQTFL